MVHCVLGFEITLLSTIVGEQLLSAGSYWWQELALKHNLRHSTVWQRIGNPFEATRVFCLQLLALSRTGVSFQVVVCGPC